MSDVSDDHEHCSKVWRSVKQDWETNEVIQTLISGLVEDSFSSLTNHWRFVEFWTKFSKSCLQGWGQYDLDELTCLGFCRFRWKEALTVFCGLFTIGTSLRRTWYWLLFVWYDWVWMYTMYVSGRIGCKDVLMYSVINSFSYDDTMARWVSSARKM